MENKTDNHVELALKKLGREIEELQETNYSLAQKVNFVYTVENWLWLRHIHKDKDDIDLPVPRLEMRLIREDYQTTSIQYLVIDDFADGIMYMPIGRTISREEKFHIQMPFRDGAHIYHTMMQLKLPGFLTTQKSGVVKLIKKLDYTDDDCRPHTRNKLEKQESE